MISRRRVALSVFVLLAVFGACARAEDTAEETGGTRSAGQEWISKTILILDGEFVSVSYDVNAPPGESSSGLDPSQYFVPGRVMAFRATTSLPQFVGTGEAGHVYRLNDRLELEEIGTFDPARSDEELRQEFGG